MEEQNPNLEDENEEDEMPSKQPSRRIDFDRMKTVLMEYTELSTIGGLVYLTLSKQTVDGKIFWLLILFVMTVLSIVWSATVYIDWLENPVLTTITSPGMNINQIPFPSVTVCPQGQQSTKFISLFTELYNKYQFEKCNVTSVKDLQVLTKYTYLGNVDPCLSLLIKSFAPSGEESFNFLGFFLNSTMDSLLATYFMTFLSSNPTNFYQNIYVLSNDKRWFYDARDEKLSNESIYNLSLEFSEHLYMWIFYFEWSLSYEMSSNFHFIKNVYDGFESPEVFKILWMSSIDCSDESFIKKCTWKGSVVPCSKIFVKTLTDLGICCSFHSEPVDNIYQVSAYSKIIKEVMLEEESKNNDTSDTIIKSYTSKSGINEGLSFMIDGQTNLMSTTTVDADFNSYTIVITSPGDFPMAYKSGISVEPGKRSLIAMNADMTSSDDDLRGLDPNDRNCLFEEENEGNKLYKKYSQNNCMFECLLLLTDEERRAGEETGSCFPWKFPSSEEDFVICSPQISVDFINIFKGMDPTNCSHCLPDCNRVQYSYSVSSEPFRKCDEKNFGVSELCKYDQVKSLPTPYIWGHQVISQLNKSSNFVNSFPHFSSDVRNKYGNGTALFWPLRNDNQLLYNAYDDDIAMVNVFFESSTAIMFQNQVSQTWYTYFAYVGGILGFFMGVSIVTLFELIWLFIKVVMESTNLSVSQNV